jgi:hypothetical protein
MDIKGNVLGILKEDSENKSTIIIFNALKKQVVSFTDSVIFDTLCINSLFNENEHFLIGLYSLSGNLCIYSIVDTKKILKVFSFMDKKFPISKFLLCPNKRLSF